MSEDELCDLTDIKKDWCAHCLGHVQFWEGDFLT